MNNIGIRILSINYEKQKQLSSRDEHATFISAAEAIQFHVKRCIISTH